MVKKVIEKELLADQAARILRDAIVTGELSPGEELPEEKIAAQLGISRTPIREALRRLQREGFLTAERGKPARVSILTEEDFLHTLEVRQINESYNVEKIVNNISETLLKQLKENIHQQEQATLDNNFNLFLELDREFHLLLASANKNPKLKEIIYEMNTGIYRVFNFFVYKLPQTGERSLKEHIDILKAIEEKNGVLAKAKMEEHIGKIASRMKEVMALKGK
ncbi:GntR family transcriptional regulator [Lysinibacillus fusiformis]|nr:GntR family transcriptional regulator [Lysinibacillus fusiformis]